MKTLKDLFLDQLSDMYDAEKRILKALPRLAEAATDPDLRDAFESHAEETQGHVTMIEEIFSTFEVQPQGKTCEATVGLLKEADSLIAEFRGSPALNAGLISAAQKVEHYEIASYGCLYEWAELLDNTDAADLLEDILTEEKEADEKLTEIAESRSNEEAEMEGDTDDEDEEEDAGREVEATDEATEDSKTQRRA